VRSDGAQNFASAHKSEMRENDECKKSMHVRRISSRRQESEHEGERQQDDPALCALVQGAQEGGAACIALNRIHILVAYPRSGVGTTPLEAAGISFRDPDKWRALINNAAAHNSVVKHGKLKPCRDIPDGQAGLRVVPVPTC